MKKITVQKVMFSSGKVTVDYNLPPETDPALIEAALYASEVDINVEYNDLVCDQRDIGVVNREDPSGFCKRCLIFSIPFIAVILVIMAAKLFGLW